MWPMRSRTAKKSSDRREAQQPLAELAALQHLGFERDLAGGRGKHQPLADGDLSARPDQRAPAVFAGRFGQHHFDAAGRLFALAEQRAPRIEPRRNHAAVVENQQVAGPEQRGKLGEEMRPAERRSRDPSPACGSCRARRAAAARSVPRADRNRSRQRAAVFAFGLAWFSIGLPEVLERPQPRAFDGRVQFFALRLELARRARSAGTCVHCAQLTQMRVNGLGTRKRSQERMVQACSGSR